MHTFFSLSFIFVTVRFASVDDSFVCVSVLLVYSCVCPSIRQCVRREGWDIWECAGGEEEGQEASSTHLIPCDLNNTYTQSQNLYTYALHVCMVFLYLIFSLFIFFFSYTNAERNRRCRRDGVSQTVIEIAIRKNDYLVAFLCIYHSYTSPYGNFFREISWIQYWRIFAINLRS